MKIVADENMPLVEEYLCEYGDIVRLPGRNLSLSDVKDADALLVRSVTKVNKSLIDGSSVKFVATATIGKDHLDIPWLEKEGIQWSSAPGCNSISVAEYVVSIIAKLRKSEGLLKSSRLKAGIIGMGNVGSQVLKRLDILGYDCLCYDPPRELRDPTFKSDALEGFVDLDLICLHAPLTKEGDYPSYHMIQREFLEKQKTGTVLISAGRGAVIDFNAFTPHIDKLNICLDVWEPEPDVPREVLTQVKTATPHIAGYSLQSKWRGTDMVCRALMDFLGKDKKDPIYPIESPIIDFGSRELNWEDVVLHLYDPYQDSEHTKQCLLQSANIGASFDALRKSYPLRHEFSFPKFKGGEVSESDRNILSKLGFNWK